VSADSTPRNPEDIEAFISDFEGCRLPGERWTHHGHLLAGLWYLWHYPPDEALATVRRRIRAHNESVGTANTDSAGYHETLTVLFLRGIDRHRAAHPDATLAKSLVLLLQSPLASSQWPLQFYSKELLFSVAARKAWVEPDLAPLVL
jgi:hypothetical protein